MAKKKEAKKEQGLLRIFTGERLVSTTDRLEVYLGDVHLLIQPNLQGTGVSVVAMEGKMHVVSQGRVKPQIMVFPD